MDPLYMHVRRYLIRQIQAGRVGDKLPSESQLQKKFGVSRVTVRLALKDLLKQGILISRKRVGIFINSKTGGRDETIKTIGIATYDNRVIHLVGGVSNFLETALKKIRMQGMLSIILHGFGLNGSMEEEYRDLRLDGILWFSPFLHDLLHVHRLKIPVIGVGNILQAPGRDGTTQEVNLCEIHPELNYSVVNLFEEGRISASLLLDKGFDKIVFINRHGCKGDFYDGILQAYKEHEVDSHNRIRFLPVKSFDYNEFASIYKQGFRGIYTLFDTITEITGKLTQNGQAAGKDYQLVCHDYQPWSGTEKPSGPAFINCGWDKATATATKALIKIMQNDIKKQPIRKTVKPTFVKSR